MGEAKRRSARRADWLKSLSSEGRTVFDVATAVYERIVKGMQATGGCYRMSFFLTVYLKQQYGIHVEPVVGYVNDGEGETMASHAWVELSGKKIDVSLTSTEHPDAQPTGQLLILDREIKAGRATYTYHRERSVKAVREIDELIKDERFRAMLLHKEKEHAEMVAIAKDPDAMMKYLDAAPDGMGYEKLARRVRDLRN